MTTIDEFLKAHPAPFRAIPLYGHYGQPQFQVCDKDGYSIAHAWGQDAQAICDAMNELVRLREDNAKLRAFEAHVRSEMDRCGVLTKTDLFVATRGDEKGGGV